MKPEPAFAELNALMKSSRYRVFTYEKSVFTSAKQDLVRKLRTMVLKAQDSKKQKELRSWVKTIENLELLKPQVLKYSHRGKNYLFMPEFWPTKKHPRQGEKITGDLYSVRKPIPLSYNMFSAKGILTPVRSLVKLQEEAVPPKFIEHLIRRMAANPLAD